MANIVHFLKPLALSRHLPISATAAEQVPRGHLVDIAFYLLFMLVVCWYSLANLCLVWFFLQILTRFETILTAGLEPHLSLKILQFNAILLGPQVVEPLAAVLRDTLMNLTSCIHSNQKGGDGGDTMDGFLAYHKEKTGVQRSWNMSWRH